MDLGSFYNERISFSVFFIFPLQPYGGSPNPSSSHWDRKTTSPSGLVNSSARSFQEVSVTSSSKPQRNTSKHKVYSPTYLAYNRNNDGFELRSYYNLPYQ